MKRSSLAAGSAAVNRESAVLQARCVSIWYMNVQKARSPSASRPWPPPAAARPGLMAPRSASMALQASAPGELRGALGRLGYLSLRRRRKGNVCRGG